MNTVTCDICGAVINPPRARFDYGFPEILDCYGDRCGGGVIDLCRDCAEAVAEFIRAKAIEHSEDAKKAGEK